MALAVILIEEKATFWSKTSVKVMKSKLKSVLALCIHSRESVCECVISCVHLSQSSKKISKTIEL